MGGAPQWGAICPEKAASACGPRGGLGQGGGSPVKLWLRPTGRGREVARAGPLRDRASLLAFLPGLGSQWMEDSPSPPTPRRLQRVL